jgi:hypothetical protein
MYGQELLLSKILFERVITKKNPMLYFYTSMPVSPF